MVHHNPSHATNPLYWVLTSGRRWDVLPAQILDGCWWLVRTIDGIFASASFHDGALWFTAAIRIQLQSDAFGLFIRDTEF